MKNCIIVATSFNLADEASPVYTKYENGAIKFLRYTPYRGAVKDHGNKPARYSKDEADRFDIAEARRILIEEFTRRGEEPEKHYWARELRIVEE